ncbi:hypothetical protein MPSEU_000131600 [Mayamaea pseudoterrestris]|nr:hypothetical protein MPSEU_000131000 [Mayamaea pseudoterrestris]GKY91597.1 hypothetical protein MPSEU_000131600 [Mayamaea pseudoterrestris]
MSSSLSSVDKHSLSVNDDDTTAKASAPLDQPLSASSSQQPSSTDHYHLDFIASSHAVKSLFSLGVIDDQSISVAIHNVDGALVLDHAHVAAEGAVVEAAAAQGISDSSSHENTRLGALEADKERQVSLSQDIIALPAGLGEMKETEALALILANPPQNSVSNITSHDSHSDNNSKLGLPVPDDYIQRFLPQQSPEPREYLPWKFKDIQLLIGSNATVYRASSSSTTANAANVAEHSTAITVRIEQTRDLQSLLERYEQDKLFALQNKPSYAQVAAAKAIRQRQQINKPLTSDLHQLADDEQGLQSCIVAAPSCPVGGLLSSRGGLISSPQHHQADASTNPASSPTSPVSTVLDIYLDNIMANVPQLALCLQDKGLIQSVKLLSTDDIPSSLMHPDTLETSTPFSIVHKADGKQVFSPEVMETNASMLLRFLQANCTKNNTTYLLRREHGETNIQLYDISTLSGRGQKRWVFWLAMMSYRFANRLRHVAMNHAVDDPALKRAWRARQRSLLRNTLELLEKLTDMDGNQRESLAAAVHEHLADSMLGLEDSEGPAGCFGEGDEEALPSSGKSVPTSPTPCVSMIQQPYANISVDALGKAQDHLAKGIKVLMPVLEADAKLHNAKTKKGAVDAEFRRRIEPVATQLFALHYKFVNVSLRLAEIHLSNYFSSSAMQALRTSARCMADSLYLVHLLDRDSDKRVYAWMQRIQLQYTWLWEHSGHFARSFAADELWRERGHASGDDVISVLQDVDNAFREHASLDLSDSFIRKTFIEPENPLTMQSNGVINLNSLNGIVDFFAPIGKRKVQKTQRNASDREVAEKVLAKRRVIVRDQRKVLIAASLAYSRSIKSFRDLLAEEAFDDTLPSENDTALIALLDQRLGDSCNETGKILLNELRRLLQSASARPNDAAPTGAVEYMLSSAQFWFFQALEVFERCRDLRNLALLRCNLCQAYKLQANAVFSSTTPKPPDGHTHADICLQEAIHHLEAAHEALGERDLDPKTWNFVSEEMAATFLVLGVRRRQSFIGSGSVPVLMQALRLSPGKEQSIVEPIERARQIYEQLGNHHQAAAAHYQLALYFSKIWTCQLNEVKTREKLTLAFQHFNAAYGYFLKAIRGNEITFCLLCIDSSGLYAAVPGLESTCKALLRCLDTADALSKNVVETKLKDVQGRADWFRQMDVITTAIDERVFKALRSLVKIENEAAGDGNDRYKSLYRIALQAKMRPAPSEVYCGDEFIDSVANRLHAMHSLLKETATHYKEKCV